MPSLPKWFIADLQGINRGLFCFWNQPIDRWQVSYKDDRTGLVRMIRTIETWDGAFKEPDAKDVHEIRHHVDWDGLMKYPSVIQLHDYMREEREKYKQKLRADRNDERTYFNKHHRREWKQAIENAKSGILYDPTTPDPKVSVYVKKQQEVAREVIQPNPSGN